MAVLTANSKVSKDQLKTLARLDLQTPSRISVIDGLRTWAATLVYLYHVWQMAGSPTAFVTILGVRLDLYAYISTGYSGVDLFMILSGLCLFLPLTKSPEKLKNFKATDFFKRRMWRLLPAYYASMIYVTALPVVLVSLFKLLHLKAQWQPIDSLWQYFTHIFLIHTFFTDTWARVYGPWWSLGVEAQLYSAFPIAILAYKRYGVGALPVIAGMSVVYQIVVETLTHSSHETDLQFIWSINLLGRWVEFAFGMCLAWIMVNRQSFSAWPMKPLVKIALPLAVLVYMLGSAQIPFGGALLGLCCRTISYSLCVLAACCGSGYLNRILKVRLIAWLGTISYSIYLGA